jgi:hypothetical protein
VIADALEAGAVGEAVDAGAGGALGGAGDAGILEVLAVAEAAQGARREGVVIDAAGAGAETIAGSQEYDVGTRWVDLSYRFRFGREQRCGAEDGQGGARVQVRTGE